MPLLSRNNHNKSLIPAVEENSKPSASSKTPSGFRRSNAATYNPSRDVTHASLTSRPEPDAPYDEEKYNRAKGVGDVYSRGEAHLDVDRHELFSGYNAEKSGSGRFFDGPDVQRRDGDGDEDGDVEVIKEQTKYVKQESVTSSRNAIKLAREAEEMASSTLLKVGDQSERLANTERHLDVSKSHSQKAADQTDELKKLNRSIFRPSITFNKDSKRRAREAEIQQRYDDERTEREKAMLDVRDTQNRIGRAQDYGRAGEYEEDEEDSNDPGGLLGSGGSRSSAAKKPKAASQRSRYQFEATASDDEMEDELDKNLDEIDDVTKRLQALGSAMGQELNAQNKRLGEIGEKTDGLDLRLATVTRRQKKF